MNTSRENYAEIDYSKGSLLDNYMINPNDNSNFNNPYNNEANPNINYAFTNNNLNKRTNVYSPSNFIILLLI